MFFHLIRTFQTLITILSLNLSNFSCLHFLLSVAQIPCSISNTFFMDYNFPYLVLPSDSPLKRKTTICRTSPYILFMCMPKQLRIKKTNKLYSHGFQVKLGSQHCLATLLYHCFQQPPQSNPTFKPLTNNLCLLTLQHMTLPPAS